MPGSVKVTVVVPATVGAVRRPGRGEAECADHLVELPGVVAVVDRGIDLVALHPAVHPDPERHVERRAAKLLGRRVEREGEVAQLGRPDRSALPRRRRCPGRCRSVAGPDARPAPPPAPPPAPGPVPGPVALARPRRARRGGRLGPIRAAAALDRRPRPAGVGGGGVGIGSGSTRGRGDRRRDRHLPGRRRLGDRRQGNIRPPGDRRHRRRHRRPSASAGSPGASVRRPEPLAARAPASSDEQRVHQQRQQRGRRSGGGRSGGSAGVRLARA